MKFSFRIMSKGTEYVLKMLCQSIPTAQTSVHIQLGLALRATAAAKLR